MGQVRISFTAKEKLRVVAYAEAHGNRAAGREFSVNESNVRLWRNQKDRLKQMPKTKMANRGSAVHYPEIEADLLKWVTDRRLQGYGISTTELRLKGLHVAKQRDETQFRASVDNILLNNVFYCLCSIVFIELL